MKTLMRAVTKARPCVICEGNHKCSYGTDGLILCGRKRGAVSGFLYLGQARGDDQFALYRAENGMSHGDNQPFSLPTSESSNGDLNALTDRQVVSTTRETAPSSKWAQRAADLQSRFNQKTREALARALAIPSWACANVLPIGVGEDDKGPFWAFPEVDGEQRIIGIVRRYQDGEKRAMAGSQRGLTVPAEWDRGFPEKALHIVEGASDVIALAAVGIAAIGRPGNCGGVDMIDTLLRGLPERRRPRVRVLGEWDPKPDGSWPGRDGAVGVSASLKARLGSAWDVRWALPPSGSKDARAWVNGLNLLAECSDSWSDAGERFLAHVEEAAQQPAAPATETTADVRIDLIDSATFAATDCPLRWLIRKALVQGQPAVLGGPKKCLKTSMLCDLAVAMGTGRSFLGSFEAERPVRVGLISGESGPHAIKSTANNVCARHGVDLARANVWWGFNLPQLSRQEHLSLLVEQIRQNSLEVVILDPLYLCLLAGNLQVNAGSMYDMGPLLAAVSKACLDAGATPILCHHNIKRPPDPFAVPELEDLAFAGIAEFARQWLLVGRRERYEPGSGQHKLWLNVGGSAGFSSCWSVDIDEGVLDADFGGKKWLVDVAPATVEIADTKDREERKRQDKQEASRKADDAKILNAIDAHCEPGGYVSAGRIRAVTGLSGDKFRLSIERLDAEQLIERTNGQVAVGKGGMRAAELLKRRSGG